MIHVKAVAYCDGAPMTKRKCNVRQAYEVSVEPVADEPSVPSGWGRYLGTVLCPKCVKMVIAAYGETAVSS